MSQFFSNCTAVPECYVDTAAQCEALKLSGVANCTDVKHETDPAVLYCWRIAIENCTNDVLCDFFLSLDPEWKFWSSDGQAATNTIFQDFFESVDTNNRVIRAYSNIPGFASSNWNGDGTILINDEPLMIPPGRWIVEICAEIPKSEIALLTDDLTCYEPALFPSLVQATYRDGGCPITATGIIGCSPDSVVVLPSEQV